MVKIEQDFTVAKAINDPGLFKTGFHAVIWPVTVDVTMEMISGLKNLQQPAKCVNPLVG